MKYLLILSALLFAACDHMEHVGGEQADGKSCSQAEKGAYFISPADNATVESKFTVRFGVNGMKIRPASDMTEGTGHHHLIIDGASVPKGTVVAKDEKNLHFGQGQSETELTLAPGKHTLTLQFADGAHSSYGEGWSQTITVDVK